MQCYEDQRGMELGQFESNGNYVLQYMGSADGGGKTALQFAI